jgi:chromosomal replication initiator protein
MEAELMKPSFDTWLKQTAPVGFFDNTLVIAVRNPFALEWIGNRYLPLIQALLQRILGRAVQVRLVVAPELPAPVVQTQPAPFLGLPKLVPGRTTPPAPDAPPATRFNSAPFPPAPDFDSMADDFPPTPAVYRRSPVASLNPKYTFDSFVVGNSNRFAHAGAMAVAEAPGRTYNPLFLYGGVGLGKTHLLQALGHHSARKFPGLAVLYVTAETFTNELINAIRDDRTMEFKNRYRNNDILLVDDIQFIAGKDRTQEEFFHTFEALYGATRQLVISSDRPPKEISSLEERLRSRLEWGLLADIQPPDLETRVAILRKKALQERLPVPDEVIMHLATQVATNIRELEGALIRIVASASLDNRTVTLESAVKSLKDILPNRTPRPVTFSDIERAVCRRFSLTIEDLKGESRARKVSFPRQVAMYLCRELTPASLPKIGEEFGDRDHTTVLHACEKLSRQRKEDPELENTIAEIQAALQDSPL